jgi:SAM-dependent methyltransferase
LGYGPGRDAICFQNKGFDVTCVDISTEMIKLCKEKGLKAFVMDFENLDF